MVRPKPLTKRRRGARKANGKRNALHANAIKQTKIDQFLSFTLK